MNYYIEEFIGLFIALHNNERSEIVSINQDGVINRYSTSRTRPFSEQPSILDDSITERKIKYRHVKTYNDPYKPKFDDDHVQSSADQQSYGEQSITDDSENVTKNHDQEITKAREILE